VTAPSRPLGPTPAVIVLEGLDGVGKSTTARHLADLLDAELLATPGADLEPARSFLEPHLDAHPEARMLWYAATVVRASDRLRALRQAGRAAVVDRYFLSTLAYAELRGATLGLAEVERALLVPDLTFYLHAPHHVREARLHGRPRNTPEDRRTLAHTADARLHATFHRLGARPIAGCFHPVLAVADPDQVAQTIRVLAALTTSPVTSPSPRQAAPRSARPRHRSSR